MCHVCSVRHLVSTRGCRAPRTSSEAASLSQAASSPCGVSVVTSSQSRPPPSCSSSSSAGTSCLAS